MRQSTYDSSIIMINKALAIRNLLLFKKLFIFRKIDT